MMHNFRVVPNDGQYKVCDHPFKQLFMGSTIARVVDVPDIPTNQYNFKDFHEILSEDFKCDLLVGNIYDNV